MLHSIFLLTHKKIRIFYLVLSKKMPKDCKNCWTIYTWLKKELLLDMAVNPLWSWNLLLTVDQCFDRPLTRGCPGQQNLLHFLSSIVALSTVNHLQNCSFLGDQHLMTFAIIANSGIWGFDDRSDRFRH